MEHSGVHLHGFSMIPPSNEGKVKMDQFDTPGYLSEKIDNNSIIVQGGLLTVNVSAASTDKYLTPDCDVSVSVGDLVYMSDVVDNLAITAPDNRTIIPVSGIVVSKPTTTSCRVLIHGILVGVHGMNAGDMVFVSLSGGMTTVRPTNGYLQVFGLILDSNRIFVEPIPQRVRLAPF